MSNPTDSSTGAQLRNKPKSICLSTYLKSDNPSAQSLNILALHHYLKLWDKKAINTLDVSTVKLHGFDSFYMKEIVNPDATLNSYRPKYQKYYETKIDETLTYYFDVMRNVFKPCEKVRSNTITIPNNLVEPFYKFLRNVDEATDFRMLLESGVMYESFKSSETQNVEYDDFNGLLAHVDDFTSFEIKHEILRVFLLILFHYSDNGIDLDKYQYEINKLKHNLPYSDASIMMFNPINADLLFNCTNDDIARPSKEVKEYVDCLLFVHKSALVDIKNLLQE